MTSKRPDGRAAFLGTDDIVRRLRDAQPSRLGRWGRAVRNAVLFAGLVGVAAVGFRAVATWRADRATSHQAAVRASPAAAADADHAASQPNPAPSAAQDASPAQSADAGSSRLEVRIHGNAHAPSLWVDGHLVAKASRWGGDLPRGHHLVEVRHKDGAQSHAVLLHSSGQEVTFDLQGHQVRSRGLRGSSSQGR